MGTQKFFQIERRSKLSRDIVQDFFAHMQEKIWGNVIEEQIPFGKLSGNRAKSVIRESGDPIPDCETCGLCCHMFPSVQITSEDVLSPSKYWEVTIDKGNPSTNEEVTINRVLRRDGETGSCISLSGKVCESVSCDIYDGRPRACRKFEAGSDKCHALRRCFGLDEAFNTIESIIAIQKLHEQDENENQIIHSEINNKPDSNLFEVEVFLEDNSSQIIGDFDPKKKSWLEGDFIGLNLTDARNLLKKSGTKQGANLS